MDPWTAADRANSLLPVAIRASKVDKSPKFQADLVALSGTYPKLGTVLDELADVLCLESSLPHFPVDPKKHGSRVHAIRVDYPPHGAQGSGLFVLVYHRTDPATPSPATPYRTYTLLRLSTRLPAGVGGVVYQWPNP